MKSFVAVTIFLLQITGFSCFGTGAPVGACVTMVPGHNGITAQSSASPYTITASASTYSPNQEITVTIAATGSEDHGGLLVQARKSDDSSTTPIGTFKTASTDTKIVTCTTADNSWTHSAQTAKTTSTVIWVAPASDAGTIVFKATVATNRATYWLNHKSGELTYSAGNGGTTAAGNGGTTAAGNGGTTAAGNGGTTAAGNMETTTYNSSTKSVVSCLLIIMCLLGLRM